MLLKEIRRTDPDVLFLAEAFTRPAMMQALGAIGYQQSYTYFTWRTAKWELEAYLREPRDRDRPRDAAELLREHARHPARLPAVRRAGGVQDPGRDRGHRVAELGRHARLRAVRARGRPPRQRGATTPRSTRSGSATGTRPRPRAARWRRTSPGSTRSGAPTLPPQPCSATCGSTGATTRTSWSSPRVPSRTSSGEATDTVIVVVNLDPHATRETMVHLDLPPSASTGVTPSWSTTITGED